REAKVIDEWSLWNERIEEIQILCSPSKNRAGVGKVINKKEEEKVMEVKMGKNLEECESGIFNINLRITDDDCRKDRDNVLHLAMMHSALLRKIWHVQSQRQFLQTSLSEESIWTSGGGKGDKSQNKAGIILEAMAMSPLAVWDRVWLSTRHLPLDQPIRKLDYRNSNVTQIARIEDTEEFCGKLGHSMSSGLGVPAQPSQISLNIGKTWITVILKTDYNNYLIENNSIISNVLILRNDTLHNGCLTEKNKATADFSNENSAASSARSAEGNLLTTTKSPLPNCFCHLFAGHLNKGNMLGGEAVGSLLDEEPDINMEEQQQQECSPSVVLSMNQD
ncbi:hypothetical protein L345_05524, partial [Ophiophagus hannah]